MIRELRVSAAETDAEEFTEPPSYEIRLLGMGESAVLCIHRTRPAGELEEEPVVSVQVPARSLYLAMQALVLDDEPTRSRS